MALIDSHAHLDLPEYDADRDQVVERARAAGVERVVLVGQWTRPDDRPDDDPLEAVRRTAGLAARSPDFFSATAGLHPHDAGRASDRDLAGLRTICAGAQIAAVGECGLDYHYDRSPREAQRARFAEQIAFAKELDKPLVVHTREADEDTAELLREGLGAAGGVIHCFTGGWDAARAYLDLGLFISVAGVLTFRNAEGLREAARRIPLERLLLETDSPFLAPVPHRGKRNEPMHVRDTAAALAGLRGLPLERIEEATSANARRALRLPPPAAAPRTPSPA